MEKNTQNPNKTQEQKGPAQQPQKQNPSPSKNPSHKASK